MANELNIVTETELTLEDKEYLNTAIDKIIIQHKQNRQDINRLVFESIESLTEADMAQKELSEKGFLRRLIGNFTGSNQKLQNKINSKKSAAQYASQQMLQKLADQNLMSFELISVVDNKLNASIYKTEERFKNVYAGLHKFFIYTRSELLQTNSRLDKVERDVNLLAWKNSIEYKVFDDTEYSQLDTTSKIICLVRDFYDVTRGVWGTQDLMLLKAAMSQIDISPKQPVNYINILREITDNEELKNKLFSGKKLMRVSRPDNIISFGIINMIENLRGPESYIPDAVEKCLYSHGIQEDNNIIIDTLVKSYVENQSNADPEIDVEAFDLILDFLFNLKTADELKLLQDDVSTPLLSSNGETELQIAINLFLNNEQAEAFKILKELVDDGNGRAAYLVGLYYFNGYNTAEVSEENYIKYWKIGAENSDVLSSIRLLICKKEDTPENTMYTTFESRLKTLSENGDLFAKDLYARQLSLSRNDNESNKRAYYLSLECANRGFGDSLLRIANMLYEGRGVEQNFEQAVKYFELASEKGLTNAQYYLALAYKDGVGVPSDYNNTVNYYQKAANQGLAQAQAALGDCYRNGLGVKANYIEAVSWYKKAADKGLTYAQCSLGWMYEKGVGIAANYQEAYKWYKKAADKGNSQAMEACKRLR